MVVSNRLEVRSQNSSIHNTRRRHHQCPRVPTCSHQGSNDDELTNNTLFRYDDAIVFSCNRANEFESGCEDVMKCACAVKVNCGTCARCATLTGTGEVLFWTGNRIKKERRKKKCGYRPNRHHAMGVMTAVSSSMSKRLWQSVITSADSLTNNNDYFDICAE